MAKKRDFRLVPGGYAAASGSRPTLEVIYETTSKLVLALAVGELASRTDKAGTWLAQNFVKGIAVVIRMPLLPLAFQLRQATLFAPVECRSSAVLIRKAAMPPTAEAGVHFFRKKFTFLAERARLLNVETAPRAASL